MSEEEMLEIADSIIVQLNTLMEDEKARALIVEALKEAYARGQRDG